MNVPGRQERILMELRMHGTVSVADFAARMGISPMTVRRDLRELADAGALRRIHGGAEAIEVPPSTTVRHRPSARRGPDADPEGGALFTLGVLSPDPSYYFPTVVDGALERTRELGGRMMLGVSRYDPDRERVQLERLIAGGADALLVTSASADDPALRERLVDCGLPVVMVERGVAEETEGAVLESVRTDHAAGAALAVGHLVELGHERIGMFTYDTPTAGALRPGFARALERRGLPGDAPVIVIEEGEDTAAQSRRCLDRALEAGVTALLVHSDHYAADFLGTALETGLEIPGDLSLISYDDEIAELAAVPLTAVSPPRRDVGRIAVGLVFDRLSSGAQAGLAARHVAVRPSLAVRASTAAPCR
ncbi:substrate-binding domain-containing protein [Brachybacterium rhamnosum]|uniref:Substrate-binding domain-containing protein n=1 Tax=Brachybacterium rhamnosum TaxID=173361 RepID=A0ABW4Q0S6_9MICO